MISNKKQEQQHTFHVKLIKVFGVDEATTEQTKKVNQKVKKKKKLWRGNSIVIQSNTFTADEWNDSVLTGGEKNNHSITSSCRAFRSAT